MTRALLGAVLALCAAGLGSGCVVTYSEKMDVARELVARGDYETALKNVDSVLGLKSRDDMPEEWESETALGMLERASLLQAIGDYDRSARDISAAEAELEYLDLTKDTVGKLAKYIYSDAAEVYRIVPTEQLALSGLNMINYLAKGDLAGARVEARRFTVTTNYLAQAAPDRSHAPFLSYLAGFIYEHLGSTEEAMRYYDEALQRKGFDSLRDPVARLAKRTPYRGKAITQFLTANPSADGSPPPPNTGELLVVVGLGRVPYKVPERLAIGAAIGIAAAWITWNTSVLERSAMKFIIYPKLVPSGSRARGAAVTVDGKQVPAQLASNLGAAIEHEYEEMKPKIIAAALTRLAARAGAAEAARAVAKKNTSEGGTLAALAVEGFLASRDEPDTRSWNFLPNAMVVARVRVPAGKRKVLVMVDADAKLQHVYDVEIPAGGFAVLPVMELR